MKYTYSLFIIFIISFLYLSCNNNTQYKQGKALYEHYCANCHMKDGQGLGKLYPPLAGADMLLQSGASAACWIANGLEGPIKVNGIEYNNVMIANKKLSAIDITNILNYVNSAWGNKAPFIGLKEVSTILEACKK